MKVVINTINFYNNVVIINHVHNNNTFMNNDNLTITKIDEDDLSKSTRGIIINDNSHHPLIAQLEERILQAENEKQELLELLTRANASKIC